MSRFGCISTTTLRAMAWALGKPPMSRALRRFRLDIEIEILARELAAVGEVVAVSVGPRGVQ